MTDAVSKCFANSTFFMGSSPPRKAIYAAKTPPATVAIPPIITRRISDLFIFGRYALIKSGASVCPKNIFPMTDKLSDPEIFRNLV